MAALPDIFRAYNRLESITRNDDPNRSLQAEVFDPLWALGRQWQFGEFRGDDAGSTILARVLVESAPLTRMQFREGTVQAVDLETPLEPAVERVAQPMDLRTAARAARQFLKILSERLDWRDDFKKNDYIARLQRELPLGTPAPGPNEQPGEIVRLERLRLNEAAERFLSAAGGWIFDACSLSRLFRSNPQQTLQRILLLDEHKVWLSDALNSFADWFEKNHPAASSETAWDEQRLEYRFAAAAPARTSGGATGAETLSVAEYFSGELDWFHFERTNMGTSKLNAAALADQDMVKQTALTKLPASLRFGGMPASRWWEFEDGAVDLSISEADTSDLARLAVSEFALIYENDWKIIPLEVPVGTLVEVKGLLLVDSFEQKMLIRPAQAGSSGLWQNWSMFQLTAPSTGFSTGAQLPARLLIPPVTMFPIESEPVESVDFRRDEMGNLVWGIESLIPDGLGGSQDGQAMATRLQNRLFELDPTLHQPGAPLPDVVLHYKLGTAVPENWIPFIPIHPTGQMRKLLMQRASMPRWFLNEYSLIRARTPLLREGMARPEHPSDYVGLDQQEKPYFIHEEEIPRGGIRVTTTVQRVRRFDGRVVQWFGRKKSSGKGEGSVGLHFDRVERIG